MAKVNSNGHAPVAELIPAAAYYRMSSEGQDASIPEQRKAVIAWAAEHGYRIVREYVDEAQPGWKDDRALFQQLIADLDRREFRAVLCWDQNRFSRFPVLEASHYWWLLDKAGVHLATVRQGRIDWTSIAGWLTATIKQHNDAQHRHELSDNVKRGKDASAEQGIWQTTAPYGYAIDSIKKVNGKRIGSGKLKLGDPLEVSVIQRIFREYCEGRSLRDIAHRLNAEGIRTRRGMWAAASVHQTLCQPAYLGTFRWGGFEIENNHPAIIDAKTAADIKRLLVERQKITTHTRTDAQFLFTGRLRCGKCGSAMVGHTKSGLKYYQCNGRRCKGAKFCDHNSCKQDELFEAVLTAIESRFQNQKEVKRIRDELQRQVRKSTRQKEKPEQIEKRLANVVDKLTKAKRRLVECDRDMLDVVQETIRELRDQQTKIEAALKAATTPTETIIDEQQRNIDDKLKSLATLRQTVQKANPVQTRERLRKWIDKVNVWSERERGEKSFKLARGVVHIRSILSNAPGTA